MEPEAELIRLLAEADTSGANLVDARLFEELDRPAAYRIQRGVLDYAGARVGMLKTAISADGVGVAAPIQATRVGRSPNFQLAGAGAVGLEVEVGVVLGNDILSAANIPAAIDYFFVGVEICGTRFEDRSSASLNASLADCLSALGYVIGPRRATRDAIDGLDIVLEFAGSKVYDKPARHGFGSVLASLAAYADNQHQAFPLHAGTIVTTGSMCGLVPTSGIGRVVAHLGSERVEFDVV